METNANYEELKESTKTVLQVVTSNDLYYGLLLLVIMIVILKVIDLIFMPLKHKRSVLFQFTKAFLKILVVCTLGMRIISLIPGVSGFTSQILMSSSLLVVVLGFVFQEGLSNIVHGFILSAFMPYKAGDRVHFTIDGESITGFIVSMSARHTVVQNVVNSSHVIIPNAKMDTCLIQNDYYDENRTASQFLDVNITYESNLDKAMEVMAEVIMQHPAVEKVREEKKITDPIRIMVRELGESSIGLRASVMTKTVDENFIACSEIRHELWRRFIADPEIEFAYPHIVTIASESSTFGTEHQSRIPSDRFTTPGSESGD